jgi:L-asparaginase / beta-aspartyl-peptidase
MAIGSWSLVIHGGSDPRAEIIFSQAERARRRAALAEALHSGQRILAANGSGLDAVQTAVRVLEDAPDFNAGRGAELTHEGHAELDASIMDGRTRSVGAVAGVSGIRNPVNLARCVMERSAHVFLVGKGAQEFAAQQGIAFADAQYFITERQLRELQSARERSASRVEQGVAKMSGTVGAVALDSDGNLAAATSTGGITNKHHGRVGDSPVVGAGVYAENGVCAVSSTGWGEFFIRNVVAYDLCARVKYAKETVEDAARHVIDTVDRMGGYGGVIAVDAQGSIATPHSTPRMAYAYAIAGREPVVVPNDD